MLLLSSTPLNFSPMLSIFSFFDACWNSQWNLPVHFNRYSVFVTPKLQQVHFYNCFHDSLTYENNCSNSSLGLPAPSVYPVKYTSSFMAATELVSSPEGIDSMYLSMDTQAMTLGRALVSPQHLLCPQILDLASSIPPLSCYSPWSTENWYLAPATILDHSLRSFPKYNLILWPPRSKLSIAPHHLLEPSVSSQICSSPSEPCLLSWSLCFYLYPISSREDQPSQLSRMECFPDLRDFHS